MKVSKLFSIEHGIAQQLSQEKNASALVNTLLTEYYEKHTQQFEKKNTGIEEKHQRDAQIDKGNETKSAEVRGKDEKNRNSEEERQGTGSESDVVYLEDGNIYENGELTW